MFLYRLVLCCCLLSLSAPISCRAAFPVGRPVLTGTNPSVALTIYDDFALVRHQRTFRLAAGEQTLSFTGIGATIQPETALLTGPGLRVLRQDFAHDPLTPQSLLASYVGREVEVKSTNPVTGERNYARGTLLGASGNAVVRIGERIETVAPDRIVFPAVPARLRVRPTLTVRVTSAGAGERRLQLAYLAGGLSWQADYVAELSADGTRLDLGAWVSLKNDSGTAYRQAAVQVVAGEVHRVTQAPGPEMEMFRQRAMVAAAAPPVPRERLLGYHLYSLPRPVTLPAGGRSQVALLQATGVPCRRQLVLRDRGDDYRVRRGVIGSRLRVNEVLELENSAAAGLGHPLPAGVVRVYTRDGGGRLQFVGEDRMDHTPRGGTVRLALGASFDVTAEKKQTDFRKLSGPAPDSHVVESGYRLTLHNGGKAAKTVTVLETIPGDWTILAESLPHTKPDSRTASWSMAVPADGSATLTYRVRVKY